MVSQILDKTSIFQNERESAEEEKIVFPLFDVFIRNISKMFKIGISRMHFHLIYYKSYANKSLLIN